MKFSGNYNFHNKIDTIWEKLNDPKILKKCITGCKQFIEKESNKTFLSCSLVSKNQILKIDLLRHLKSILPNYMIPKKYYILKKIPTNKNGKLDKFHMKNTNELRQLI